MRITVFSSKSYDERFLSEANQTREHELEFCESRLTMQSASLAAGSQAVCVFVNDELHADVIRKLHDIGVRLIALRCAGFNNVDLPTAAASGIAVVRVPAYSPHAVAEHTVGLMLSLNRNIHRAYQRVREGDFRLTGLLGFDMYGKTAGVIGTGAIGTCVAQILAGFGCTVLAYDVRVNPACQPFVSYMPLDELWQRSDVITLHCPLTPETRHMVNDCRIASLKRGAMLINTGRGALADTQALIRGLKTGQIGTLGLDVYEEEASLFFEDHSDDVLQDDAFARLLTFPNVLVTGHQAFFTAEALQNIAEATLQSIDQFAAGNELTNAVSYH